MARAVLVIADIGGYTKFMKVHRINLAHAQYVVAQLLEAVIDGAGKKLELAKLESGAVVGNSIQPFECSCFAFVKCDHLATRRYRLLRIVGSFTINANI